MKRDKWILKVRNQLASLAMECDSAAAINGSRLTDAEREELQTRMRNAVSWIDAKLGL